MITDGNNLQKTLQGVPDLDSNSISGGNPVQGPVGTPAIVVELDKKAGEFVKKEFERYESYWKKLFDKFKTIYERWSNEPAPRPSGCDWMNQVNVPVIIEGEQTITPRLFTALFPTDAPLEVQAEGETPVEEGNIVKETIKHYFRVGDVQVQSMGPLTQCTLFGTGYVESGSWYQRSGWIVGPNGERSRSIIEARPLFKPVDIFEMFPHPCKMEIDDGLPLIRRRYVDKQFLTRLKDGVFGYKNIQKALDSSCAKQGEDKKDFNPEKGEYYELLEYWGPLSDKITNKDGKITDREEIPYWCMVINREVVIRAIPNPYNHQLPPYCKFKLFEDARPNWFGVGIGLIGLPIQERLNKLVNQRLDNVDLVMNKQGFYNGGDPLINQKDLQISKPGKWHKVSDVLSSVRWMDTPDVTVSSYNEEKLAKEDFREATGASSTLSPTQTGQHRTAMGISILQGAAGIRFKPVLRKIESQLIQQTAMFFLSNLRQFMTEEQWVLITGEAGRKTPIRVTPEQLLAKVFFIPTGISETEAKDIQIQNLLQFKQYSADDPTVNRNEINKRIAELMGFKHLDKIVVPQQPMNANSSLDANQQARIQQRVAEGASPEQIRMELLGGMPTEGEMPPGYPTEEEVTE